MEKTEIIKILKKPSWEVGEKYKVQHRVPYSEVVFDMEIEYENAPYCPNVPWSLTGKVLFNGEWKGGTIGRRYPTLEALLVHICNNFNDNVNIHNHYKKIEDYF
jgi:hypothetical protein